MPGIISGMSRRTGLHEEVPRCGPESGLESSLECGPKVVLILTVQDKMIDIR